MCISFDTAALCNGLQSSSYILQMVQSEKKRPWWSARRKIHSQVHVTGHDPNWLKALWCRVEAIKEDIPLVTASLHRRPHLLCMHCVGSF